MFVNPAEYEVVSHPWSDQSVPLSDLERHSDAVPHDQDFVGIAQPGIGAAMAVMGPSAAGLIVSRVFPPGFVGCWEAARNKL